MEVQTLSYGRQFGIQRTLYIHLIISLRSFTTYFRAGLGAVMLPSISSLKPESSNSANLREQRTPAGVVDSCSKVFMVMRSPDRNICWGKSLPRGSAGVSLTRIYSGSVPKRKHSLMRFIIILRHSICPENYGSIQWRYCLPLTLKTLSLRSRS